MNGKRYISILLILAICIGFLSGVTLHVEAASVDYVITNDGYIYNWGVRGELATFLSPKAEEYYTKHSVSYASLSSLSGSATQSAVPSSALYQKLQTIMQDDNPRYSTYVDTRNLYKFTDCQNSASNKVSLIYCGGEVYSTWDEGATWEREHTWPKSKSLNGGDWDPYTYSDETDIMMLRPACRTDNSNRYYYAYGSVTDPDQELFYPNVNDTVDVRGDVARTMLYGYVRWGNTSRMFGSDGVIQSLELLLTWVKADPVDTWEMGRNDAVEALNGNRNIFVDYPELAFLLFGRQVPDDMSTPSGSVKCEHEDNSYVEAKAPNCTEPGYEAGYFCNDCNRYYEGHAVIDPLGHNWQYLVCTGGQICTTCGEEIESDELGVVSAPMAGIAYKLGIDKKDGVIRYFSGSTESSSITYRLAATTDVAQAVDVYLESTTGGYRMYFMKGSTKTYIRMCQYTSSAGKVSGSLALTTSMPSEIMTFDSTVKTMVYEDNSGNSYYMGTYGTYTTFSASNTSYITGSNAANVDVSQFPARLYSTSTGAGHSWQDATCSTPKTCTVCDTTEGSPTGEHSYVDGVCSVCGAVELFKISGMSMALESYLEVSFMVKVGNWKEGYYALVEHETDSGVVTEKLTEWKNYNGGTHKQVSYKGVAAKQLVDTLNVTIYNADNEKVSTTYSNTVKTYLEGRLTSNQPDTVKTVAVDLLNYGAAAQDNFGYKTSTLANADLTEADQARATSAEAISGYTVETVKGYANGTAMIADYAVIPGFVYKNDKLADVAYAKYSYTTAKGAVVEDTIEVGEFETYAGTFKRVLINDVPYSAGVNLIEIQLYDANNNPIGEPAYDSVASYTKNQIDKGAHAVFTELLKVVHSSNIAFG